VVLVGLALVAAAALIVSAGSSSATPGLSAATVEPTRAPAPDATGQAAGGTSIIFEVAGPRVTATAPPTVIVAPTEPGGPTETGGPSATGGPTAPVAPSQPVTPTVPPIAVGAGGSPAGAPAGGALPGTGAAGDWPMVLAGAAALIAVGVALRGAGRRRRRGDAHTG
jgi:LPXTG-motif cell wall-anchored protein